jgi:hypothetical protein
MHLLAFFGVALALIAAFADPTQWSAAEVLSWLQWTSRQFSLPDPVPDQWDLNGTSLDALSEEDFTRRSPQVGTRSSYRIQFYFHVS